MSRILLSLLLASPLALSSNTFQGPCIPVETCLNIVDMHYNEAGTVPAGDFPSNNANEGRKWHIQLH